MDLVACMKTIPGDISLKPQGHNIHAFAGFFDKYDMDVCARVIVTYCTKVNRWKTFSLTDILETGRLNDSLREQGALIHGFECLLDSNWITQSKGSRFAVTPDFVNRCKTRSDQTSKK